MRLWFHANPDRWQEFGTRYRAELMAREDLVRELAGMTRTERITLLYASRDQEHNNAIVLRDHLRHWAQVDQDRHGRPA